MSQEKHIEYGYTDKGETKWFTCLFNSGFK